MRNKRVSIKRGEAFVHSVDLQAGQSVEWDFTVNSGPLDSILGESNIEFTACAFWLAPEGITSVKELPDFSRQVEKRLRSIGFEDVERRQLVGAKAGKVKGKFQSPRPGILWLRWTNEHSAVRAKSLMISVNCTQARPNGLELPHAAGASAPGGADAQQSKEGDSGWACCGGR
mmetsp:Transcript_66079/g.138015  ORF Transcript_66079/g.138015 Transcript_66079/m.138015 type:complete len:173 (-) Transcript_66079:59-577(-)